MDNYEFKGTKGEWKWDGKVWDYDKEDEAPYLMSEDSIVLKGEIECENENDAHLISAAPDLLDAAIGIIKLHEKAHTTEDLFPLFQAILKSLKPAVEKALNIK